MKRKIENQRSQIADLHEKAKGGRDNSSDSEYDGEEEGTYNRGHPALSRHNKKNKKGKVS